jgi:predicted RNase H-like HicB family nuclease
MKSAVVYEQAQNSWAAYVPDFPGCITAGKTFEESVRNIREAIAGHIRALREFGEPAPAPRAVAGEIEISPAA